MPNTGAAATSRSPAIPHSSGRCSGRSGRSASGARAARIVPRERQREEIGSDFYHGGVLIEEAGGLHPGKLHRGLHAAAPPPGPSCTATPRCSAWSAPVRA